MTSNQLPAKFTAWRALGLALPIVAMATLGMAASTVPANADWPPGEPDAHAYNCDCAHTTAQQAQQAQQQQRATRMATQTNSQVQQH